MLPEVDTARRLASGVRPPTANFGADELLPYWLLRAGTRPAEATRPSVASPRASTLTAVLPCRICRLLTSLLISLPTFSEAPACTSMRRPVAKAKPPAMSRSARSVALPAPCATTVGAAPFRPGTM